MVNDLIKKTERLLVDNASSILTGLGVSGTITTAYLAGKASWRANRVLGEDSPWESVYPSQRRAEFKKRVGKVWKFYIPAGVSGAFTIACVIGARQIGSRRTAAAYSLLTISDKAFTEYREKIIETIGDKKEKAVRDEIATSRVIANPPPEQLLVISGAKNVLCCDLFTGRYFHSDMETLRKAQNDVNAKLYQHDYVTVTEFYNLVGLERTSYSDQVGWSTSKGPLELSFTTVMSDDGRPCLAYEFNYTNPF